MGLIKTTAGFVLKKYPLIRAAVIGYEAAGFIKKLKKKKKKKKSRRC